MRIVNEMMSYYLLGLYSFFFFFWVRILGLYSKKELDDVKPNVVNFCHFISSMPYLEAFK